MCTCARFAVVVLQTVEVGPQQRDEIVRWLTKLRRQFQFNPETLALSVALLDRFLQSVKVSDSLFSLFLESIRCCHNAPS